MKGENKDLPVQGSRNNKLGGNLVVPEEAEAPTPFSPGREVTSTTNDNYCSSPTVLTTVVPRLDKSLLQRNFQTVDLKVLDSFKYPR